MEMVILDENLREIDRFKFMESFENRTFKQVKDVVDIGKDTKELLNNLDYKIGVYSPVKDSNDFYISFLNESLLNSLYFDLNKIKGVPVSEVFLYFEKNDLMINVMRNVYNSGQKQIFYFEYYENNILHRRLGVKIMKVGDFVYLVGKDEEDYVSLSLQQNKLFDNDINGIVIVQDGRFVKVNKKYLELYGHKSYDDVIGKKVGYTGLVDDSTKLINDTLKKILDGKIFSYTLPLEVKKDGKLFHYFILYGNYIIYEGRPAVLAIYNDITEQELNRREVEKKTEEALFLQDNMEFVQSVSSTGSAYVMDNKYIYSPQLYKLLERDPLPEDRNRDITWEFVIDEDKPIVQESYGKLNPENDFIDYIVRINTTDENIKYLHCYIRVKYENNKPKTIVCFYQDVTDEQLYLMDLKKALKESLRLRNNLEKIQKISKTGMSFSNDKGTLDWTEPSFETLKLDPEKYKDYHGGLVELILEEDLNNWSEAYAKCSPSHPEETSMQRLINGNGEIAYIKCYIVCDYDEEGNEIERINFYEDITEQVERENDLKEALDETLKLRDNLNRIQNASKTAMGYSTNLDYSNWTPEVFDLLEINQKDYVKDTVNIIERFVIDEDLELRRKSMGSLSPSNPNVEFVQRVKTGKGNIKYIRTIMHHEYDDEGNFVDLISFNQDITREMEYQSQLKTALKDKEILLSEVHHRVKNNLQIILSLINLNMNYDSDTGDILLKTQNRIYAMALIHEKIYGSASLSEVNMKDYTHSLVTALFELYESNIKLHLDMEPLDLDMEKSIPLGLIINELVTNTMKYAFPDGKDGNIYIKFETSGNHGVLTLEDDGIGLPDDFDLNSLSSLGLIVVSNLTLQIGGTLSIMDSEGAGFKIEFDID